MERFSCSPFRTFSVDFLDLRQKFWQVVRTVKNLSRIVFEEFFSGAIVQFLNTCTWIFSKKLYFSQNFSEWLSKVHSTFLKEQIKSQSLFIKTRFSVVSFEVKQKELPEFGQDFQRSCKTTFHVTGGKSCGYRFFRKNYKIPLKSKLEGK